MSKWIGEIARDQRTNDSAEYWRSASTSVDLSSRSLVRPIGNVAQKLTNQAPELGHNSAQTFEYL